MDLVDNLEDQVNQEFQETLGEKDQLDLEEIEAQLVLKVLLDQLEPQDTLVHPEIKGDKGRVGSVESPELLDRLVPVVLLDTEEVLVSRVPEGLMGLLGALVLLDPVADLVHQDQPEEPELLEYLVDLDM